MNNMQRFLLGWAQLTLAVLVIVSLGRFKSGDINLKIIKYFVAKNQRK